MSVSNRTDEKRSGILDGLHKQLKKRCKPSGILACLAFASDEWFEVGNGESSDDASEIVEVGFSLNQNNIIESESEDDLFGTGFERWSNYRMESFLRYDPCF